MKQPKKALITGVTGQDGAYLCKLLLEKGYEVHGIKRRSSQFNTQRVDPFYQSPQSENNNFFLHFGDLCDSTNVLKIVQLVQPDEIYNLGAQSHVNVSFETPEYTANVNSLGALRLLESIRVLGLENKTKFYQASTSELFGNSTENPQKETTPLLPRSPYGISKLYAYWTTKNYREAYGIFAVNGILFNHESPLRGETFVTRKISRAVASILYGDQDCVYLGNLEAKRDWGHAKEYVEGMWKMLQNDESEDFVLATGESITVREFARLAFQIGGMDLEFSGSGKDEVGVDLHTGKVRVKIDETYYRRSEVNSLVGDASKAKKKLGWEPKIKLKEICQEMVKADIYRRKNEQFARDKGQLKVEEIISKYGIFDENK